MIIYLGSGLLTDLGPVQCITLVQDTARRGNRCDGTIAESGHPNPPCTTMSLPTMSSCFDTLEGMDP